MGRRSPSSSVFLLERWSIAALEYCSGACHQSISPLLHHSMVKVIIPPSILAADFSRLAEEIHRVYAACVVLIYCDIMVGHFVDNISFGADGVRLVRKETSLQLDVQLMI